jgi:hypothetical protein
VSLFFPRLHPLTVASWAVLYVVCWLFDEPNTGGVLYGLPPLVGAGIALGATYLGAQVVGGLQKARAAKRALAEYKNSPEYKAMSAVNKKAAEQEFLKNYGLSEAEKRRGTEEAGRAFTALTSKTAADLKADMADPTKRGRAQAGLTQLTEGAKSVAVKATGDQERLSQQVGTAERAQNLGLIAQAAGQKKALTDEALGIQTQKIDTISGGVQDVASLGLGAVTTAAGGPTKAQQANQFGMTQFAGRTGTV